MTRASYHQRIGEIEHYFDRTALDAWKKLTGDQPVSGIRATVRQGREAMRSTLASWLPQDLSGWRILDAGCGSGVLSMELMGRGADVVGIDLSAQMVSFARQRAAEQIGRTNTSPAGTVTFKSGDMLDPYLGRFDAVIAMDVLIHYAPEDAKKVLEQFAERTRKSLIFTLAPSSRLLKAKLMIGKAFPRADRAPAIYPANPERLVDQLVHQPHMTGWKAGRSHRVSVGFYTSQAMEVCRS
ncbi:magnesium protoporphyrin IX methyltransferase [Roseibium denhamense]|uniref:Magnesium protoporphyrin IX methyltransferase n=1 Tax=Roseibium denhamense TaxID=76305 RepID=A0ABY1PKW5_9HYPH|nr:magnesium protoporphyrin IX methyltransferase [Roseibium denhamense]MTI07082.1 magnesium protoporphyrin IX methyltransferase [Roseibium denhamense]SMP36259.1 Mg-protoporphyrin IX methyltransferase [Roseibium denhamense]